MVINDIDDIQKLVEIVFTERQSRTTKMNNTSSRSHCITTIFLTKKIIKDDKICLSKSTFQFIDLSGSERTDKTDLSSEINKKSILGGESVAINWDLWALGSVLDNINKYSKPKMEEVKTSLFSTLCYFLEKSLEGKT